MSKLWETTINGSATSKKVEALTVGNDYLLDMHLVPFDVKASIAHAQGLHLIEILSKEEFEKIKMCLNQLLDEYESGEFVIDQHQEDCHTAIEEYLIFHLGDIGKKMHTGRSRNDQVLTALRLYEIDQIQCVSENAIAVAKKLLSLAKKHEFVPMPGYTHTQPAMLSSVGMWAGSFAEMLNNSIQLLHSIKEMINQSPLGTAAGYGVDLPLERNEVSALLGFKKPITLAMTAQHSRGKWEATVVHGLSSITDTLAHFANDLILFSSFDFGFFSLDDGLTTGSSIMPQKKNLDLAELMRAKHQKLLSNQQLLNQVTTNLHSGYHRDLQLTKEPVIDSFQICGEILQASQLLLDGLTVNKEKIHEKIHSEIFAANEANKLVLEGIPFRDAYQMIKNNLQKVNTSAFEEYLKQSTHLGGTGNLGLDLIEKNLNRTSLNLELRSDREE